MKIESIKNIKSVSNEILQIEDIISAERIYKIEIEWYNGKTYTSNIFTNKDPAHQYLVKALNLCLESLKVDLKKLCIDILGDGGNGK